MTDGPTLDVALSRLASALAKLGDVVERRLEHERGLIGREIEVQALNHDRARLAGELDEAFASVAQLDAANRDVARRVEAAMDAVRSVLESQER